MARRLNAAMAAALFLAGACTKKGEAPPAAAVVKSAPEGAADAGGATSASPVAAPGRASGNTAGSNGGPAENASAAPAASRGTDESAASGSSSPTAKAASAFDWKPAFAASFIRREDLTPPAKPRAPSAAEVTRLAQSSPSLRTTAPGAGYADAQKGHCLVAAMIQQNLEATADSYALGGSIAVGACSIKLRATAVPVKSGTVRFFRGLACPGGKFEDLVKDKPTWARFRQAPELARCADAKTVYVSEQVEATLVIAKQKGSDEQTFKYLSGRLGADGGPCIGTLVAGVAQYQGCYDFERIEGGKAIDFLGATFSTDARPLAGKEGGFATAAAALQVDDWQGTLKAELPAETRLHLERGADKIDTVLAEPTADDNRTAVIDALRALRRNLQTDPAAAP